MRRPLSRTFFGLAKKVLRGDGDSAALMARQTPTAGRSRWSSPVAVRGAPKAQGLMNGSAPADHETVSLSHVCHLVFACGGVNPRLEPIARVRPLVAQTYIRSGLPHTKLPHALLRGRRAPRRMGPILNRGIFQPSPRTVTHPPWIAVLVAELLLCFCFFSL